MKTVKKIVSIFLSLAAILSTVVFCSNAEDEPTVYSFTYRHGVEVIVEDTNGLPYEQIKRIADHIAGEEIEDETDHIMLNPQCAAGNHDLVCTYVTRTDHNVYSAPLRCLAKYYNVYTCCRIGCFYEIEEFESSKRVNDGHG